MYVVIIWMIDMKICFKNYNNIIFNNLKPAPKIKTKL